jgi:hypothetical protein
MGLSRLPDRTLEVGKPNGLLQVVPSPELHGGDGALQVGISRQDHHFGLHSPALQLLHHRHPVHSWHPEIKQHDVKAPGVNQMQRFHPGVCSDNLMPERRQAVAQHFTHVCLVIDNKNPYSVTHRE